MQVKEVTSYSFYEFCRDAQEAILQGYRFDFDSNANFPQQFGSMLTAIMVLKVEPVPEKYQADANEDAAKAVAVEQFLAVVQQEDKPVVKPGRKPRV